MPRRHAERASGLFGQTVNIASRVQNLASSRAIYATGSVVGHQATAQLLETAGVSPVPQRHTLRGIGDNFAIYEIP
jgi:class 3 adenylate cyclase